MADGKPVEVEGLAHLVKELGRFDVELQAEVVEANQAAAGPVASLARLYAPHVDGLLEASIRAGATKRSGVVRAGRKAVPYAGPVHFGWPARHIEPNPFLWEALDDRRAEIERDYVERLAKVAEAVK